MKRQSDRTVNEPSEKKSRICGEGRKRPSRWDLQDQILPSNRDTQVTRRSPREIPHHIPFHHEEDVKNTRDKNLPTPCQEIFKDVKPSKSQNIDRNSKTNVKLEKKITENKQTAHREALWEIPEVLAENFSVPLPICTNFTTLIQDDCTLPFIARYRKEMVGNLEIETLRKMKSSMEDLQKVKGKIISVISSLEKQKALTPSLNETICNIKDLDELEFCYAPFKDTKKKTLAAKAKELGLEEAALSLLNTSKKVNIESLINMEVAGLESIKSVTVGIQHVIADVIGKDKKNLDKMDDLVAKGEVYLQVSKSRSASKQDPAVAAKFQSYEGRSLNEKQIKPHEVLALNRGEDLKILSIKFVFSSHIKNYWTDYCLRKYLNENNSRSDQLRKSIISESIEDAYSRIVEPIFVRRIKSRLTEKAHNASIDVFARNLKCLLLSPPLPNTTVLGLDPGFRNGCKCAVVAPNGSVLHTETIYIRFEERDILRQSAAASLKNMVRSYNCFTVGLGNGKACRETESFLSQLIQSGAFEPFDVKYTIVNESGASIYSCSPEARTEFPKMDPNVISAISIARRLQDPLTEYVRVSPQHIGIGMYQHDVSVKKLEAALDDVVSECVSYVGVDLNVCPLHVLSKVAGLSSNKAKKIIDFRSKHGLFFNRQQILDVPTIGPKTFQQCAGFLTIPEISTVISESEDCKPIAVKKSVRGKKAVCHLANPLDRTCVHPESYHLAEKIVKMFNGNLNLIGHEIFIESLNAFLTKKDSKQIAVELSEEKEKIEQIVNSLMKPLRYDLRTNFVKPLFKRSITSMADIVVGQVLTGRITNVTDFGAFLDIGVGKDALLHKSGMRGQSENMIVTKQVSVRVTAIDKSLQRISVELEC